MKVKPILAIALAITILLVACSRKPDDAAVANTIKASLFSDPTTRAEPIQVTVKNGEASLMGDVSSEDAHQRVLSLTQGVRGVSKIHDSLHVLPPLATLVEPPPVVVPEAVPLAPPPPPPPVAKPRAAAKTSPGSNRPLATSTATHTPAAPLTTPSAVAPPPTPEPPPPPPPQPRKVMVPSGTNIHVTTIDSIDSDKNQIGNTFQAALSAPIMVGNDVIVPERTTVYLLLMDAASAGKLKGKSEIQVALDSLELNGHRYRLQTSMYDVEGKSQGKQTAKKVGIGAAIGTAVGAIAGGGKGAAIGAAAGGGAGLATQAFKKGDRLQIPSETKLNFTLQAPVEITLPPIRNPK